MSLCINPSVLQASLGSNAVVGSDIGKERGFSAGMLLEFLFEPAMICRNERILKANKAACALLGRSSEGVAGKPLSECISLVQETSEDNSSLSSGTIQDGLPAVLLRPDRHPVHVMLRAISYGEAAEEKIFLLQEKTGRQSIASDSSQLEILPWPMMRLDSGLHYLECNAALTRKLPLFVSLVPGKLLCELGWPAEFCLALEQAAFSPTLGITRTQFPLSWPASALHYRFTAELIPERDPHGTLRSFLIAIHDTPAFSDEEVSARLRHAQKDREQALAASHARDAFFSWISHELRTPLNGIQSWAHILETYVNAGSDSPLAGRALHGIRTGIAQQLRLIEELVDVSRILEGRFTLSRHTFALNSVAQSAIESIRPAALARGILLSCRYPSKEILLENDPCRVQQVLHLLLSNAVESSLQDGIIRLSARRFQNHSIIRIAHRCSHMPDRKENYEGNESCENRNSRHQMNLFLARSLAERLGGSVTSQPTHQGDEMRHILLLPLCD